MAEPGAYIDIVNTVISTPFTGARDNDVIFTSSHPSQRIVFGISNNPIMTLSNQNVGIGTLTPSSRLHVEGDVSINGTIITQNPMAFTGITINRTTPSIPSASLISPVKVDNITRDAQSNTIISTRQNRFIAYMSGSNELLRITSNSFIGIGTSNPSHRFTIQGVNSSFTNGPHIATLTTADNFPLTQILSWNHNSIFVSFDGYFDGTNWRASHTSGFQIGKSNNQLSLYYNGNNNVAGNPTTFQPALTVNSNGFIGINTTAPTSQLTVNGDIACSKVISPMFRAIQVFDNRAGPISGLTSANFTVGGGTLYIRCTYSLYNNNTANPFSISTLTLTLRNNTTTVSTITSTYGYNIMNDHRTFAFTRVLTGIPAGTQYNFTTALSGTTGTWSDTNDYISLTIVEYPF